MSCAPHCALIQPRKRTISELLEIQKSAESVVAGRDPEQLVQDDSQHTVICLLAPYPWFQPFHRTAEVLEHLLLSPEDSVNVVGVFICQLGFIVCSMSTGPAVSGLRNFPQLWPSGLS